MEREKDINEFICKLCHNPDNKKAHHRRICVKCWGKQVREIRKCSPVQQKYMDSDKYKESQIAGQKKRNNKVGKQELNEQSKKRMEKQRLLICDSYIIKLIRAAYHLKQETIKEHPELIENHSQQIKVKRLLKSLKNGI